MNNAVILTALLTVGTLAAQPSIHLKSTTRRTPRTVTSIRGGNHYILVFNSTPTSDTHRDLAARGIRVLQFVPDTGLMVTMPSSADLSGLDLAYTTSLDSSDKL